jgi:outer membrane receptor protein involved in Fe transport
VGPSFLDPTSGKVTCGTPSSPIGNCTPINIFNINDPATIAGLNAIAANPTATSIYTMKQAEVNANGELFHLPAGAVNLAVGMSYRKESTSGQVEPIALANDQSTCGVVEFCTTALSGSFNVKEAYAEMLVPLLADKPFAHALNLTIGSRYSDYSSAGSTTNSKISLEWRPIDDLLLRGTVSQVFRAPNIGELYSGVTADAPTVTDPCIGYTGGHDAACVNVPTNGKFTGDNVSQLRGRVSGSVAAGYSLKPEKGKSYDFGIVYDPQWLPGVSTSVDVWRINLQDTITALGAQTALNQCYGNSASPFCSFIHRYDDGNINYFDEPTVNLGELSTKGIDTAIGYRLPDTRYGSFSARLDSTYMVRYDVNPNPADPGSVVIHNAGTYSYQFGNFPRWRGLGSLNWTKGPWSASWRMRYVGRTKIGSADPNQGLSADAGQGLVVRKIGAVTYHDLQLGYNVEPWHTRFDVGIDNVADKQPPLFYANVSNNANTDVSTYDLLGRYYWVRATVHF